MKLTLFSLLTTFSLSSSLLVAQVSDNFDDGDFTNTPTWSGSTSDFEVLAGQLKTNANTSNTNTQLYIPSTTFSNGQWEFFVNPKLATSYNNYVDVFLAASSTTLSTATGYFVRIGGTPDEISLFKTNGTTPIVVIDGRDGFVSSSSNNPKQVKVTRSSSGIWSLWADSLGTGLNYELMGTTSDNTYTSSAYFGFNIKYSAANATKFFFDAVQVGAIVVDNTPPTLSSISIPTNTSIDVLFSETLKATEANISSNYTLSNGISINSALLDVLNPNKVRLNLATPLVNGVTYTLTVNGVKDLNNNAINPNSTQQFTYSEASDFAVLINEFMADPEPVVGTPAFEYIELYNRSNQAINLSNWKISANGSSKVLNSYVLNPQSYVVLGTSEAISNLQSTNPNVPALALTSFPSIANTEGNLSLLDNNNKVIHSVNYSDDWYKNTAKDDGGWSLELIDPLNPCAGSSNWGASNDISGSTLGRVNSIKGSNPDPSNPKPLRAYPLKADTILLFFSEPIPTAQLTQVSNYTLSNGIQVLNANVYGTTNSVVQLALNTTLQTGTIYTITVASSLSDCAGNALSTNTSVKIALPDVVGKDDLVINELLADPKTGGVDYVELYNRSSKIIDLKQLFYANSDSVNNIFLNHKAVSTEGYLLFPNTYLVSTTKPEVVAEQYSTNNADVFLTGSLPTLNSDEGSLALLDFASTPIDILYYTDQMHFPILQSTDGVALERLNPNRPSNDVTNWSSAAEKIGFGTPGLINSQYTALGDYSTLFSVEPEIFSPDNDGFDDQLNLKYSLKDGNYALSITIYNSAGQFIATAAKSLLVDKEGAISWNGVADNMTKATGGIYIAYFEAINPNGKILKGKHHFVVGVK